MLVWPGTNEVMLYLENIKWDSQGSKALSYLPSGASNSLKLNTEHIIA